MSRGEAASGGRSHAVIHIEGVPFGAGSKRFSPVPHDLDRLSSDITPQGCEVLKQEVDLAAETSSCCCLDDANSTDRQIEHSGYLMAMVVWTLAAAMDNEHLPFPVCKCRFGFDIGMVHGLGDEISLNHHLGLIKSRLDIPFADFAIEEDVPPFVDFSGIGLHGFPGVKESGEDFIVYHDLSGRLAGEVFVSSDHHGYWLPCVTRLIDCQERLIFTDNTVMFGTGDVFGGQHGNNTFHA